MDRHDTDNPSHLLEAIDTADAIVLGVGAGLSSIAFCCISTGVFGFPQREAAEIAVRTVREWLHRTDAPMTVVFNVFSDEDRGIYAGLLGI